MLVLINLLIAVIFLLVPVLVAIAFSTLLERKVMASMQRRVGPNVVGYLGLLQPLADGLKLLVKEPIIPRKANKIIFVFAPMLVLFLSLFVWFLIPFGPHSHSDLELGLLYLIVISVVEIYGILLAGWSSNSKYALLGGLRSTAQMISYELAISFIFLIIVLVTGSFNLTEIVEFQTDCWLIVPLLPIAVIFFISILAETNRTPFDLPEAEAELVAGYNVEYSGMLFAFFFLGEYSNMIVLSTVFSLLFLGGWTFGAMTFTATFAGPLILAIKSSLVLFTFVWVRATLPRYRYDQLMQLGWKIFLPFTFSYFVFLVMLFYFTGALPQHYDIYPFEMWPVLNN
jgi:NADH-quinone oxidoreductase subunit H